MAVDRGSPAERVEQGGKRVVGFAEREIPFPRSVGNAGFDFREYRSMFLTPKRLGEPYAWVEHVPFAFFLVDLIRPKLLVELGVHTGTSYSAFCQAVEHLNCGTACYGIDTWQGDPHAGVYGEEVYRDFSQFNSEHYGLFSQLLRLTFDEGLSYFSDGSIDLLHIDGFHAYEAVKHDFETWLPKLSKQGVVLFHDVAERQNEFGVWKLWEELSARYPAVSFRHGHGLGVLLVGESPPEKLVQLIEDPQALAFADRLFAELGQKLLIGVELEKAAESLTQCQQRLADFKAGSEAWQSQLSLDCGGGWEERLTRRRPVSQSQAEIRYDLRGFEGVQRLRLWPFSGICAFSLESLEITFADGAKRDYADSKEARLKLLRGLDGIADSREGELFVFLSQIPSIEVEFAAAEKPVELVLKLEFAAWGSQVYELLHGALTQKYGGLVERAAKLEGEKEALLRQMEVRLTENKCLSEAVSRYSSDRASLEREKDKVAALETLVAEKDRLMAEQSVVLEGVLCSRSWKITSPLRAFMNRFK